MDAGTGTPPELSTVAAALAVAANYVNLGTDDPGAFLTEDGEIVVTGYFK